MSRVNCSLLCALLLTLLCPTFLVADEPVFNEMPRWSEGWGVQVIQEQRRKRNLLIGKRRLAPNMSEYASITHIEGVYTWDKSIRLTAKLSYVNDARRELLDAKGRKFVQHDEGIGDLTLGLPLKKYFNLDGRSGAWSLTPQLIVPLDDKDDYELYNHEWGFGLSTGYATETHRYLFSTGVGVWHFAGHEPFQANANLDLGLNIQAFGSSGHIKWENDFVLEDDGTRTLTTGVGFYWMFTDLVHAKVTWKHDLYDYRGTIDHGNGDALLIGFAIVY
jgi:hypothetical protein